MSGRRFNEKPPKSRQRGQRWLWLTPTKMSPEFRTYRRYPPPGRRMIRAEEGPNTYLPPRPEGRR